MSPPATTASAAAAADHDQAMDEDDLPLPSLQIMLPPSRAATAAAPAEPDDASTMESDADGVALYI